MLKDPATHARRTLFYLSRPPWSSAALESVLDAFDALEDANIHLLDSKVLRRLSKGFGIHIRKKVCTQSQKEKCLQAIERIKRLLDSFDSNTDYISRQAFEKPKRWHEELPSGAYTGYDWQAEMGKLGFPKLATCIFYKHCRSRNFRKELVSRKESKRRGSKCILYHFQNSSELKKEVQDA